MPWHDVQIELHGLAARDVARNFIERWNHHKRVQYPFQNIEMLQLEEESIGFATGRALGPCQRNQDTNSLPLSMDSRQNLEERGTCCVQVIRSMDRWSGSTRNERSIYGAYIRAINSAEHFIYIENQYLSSNLAGGGVENKVAQLILDKLCTKIARKVCLDRSLELSPRPLAPLDSKI
jgi:phospholipase D1/2